MNDRTEPAAPRVAELDAQALANLRALDPTGAAKLVPRVVQAFEGSTARLMPQLLAAREGADLGAVRHVAHTLKSSSASVGALVLSARCAELEAQARGGAVDDLHGRVAALADEVDAVLRALKTLPDAR